MHFPLHPIRLLFAALLFAAAGAGRATDVLGYHNDQQSTGQNLTETQLTPSSIQTGSFGLRFSTPVDGQVYAQPLYKAGVNITTEASLGSHNAVFVATEHCSLYAIDAQSGEVLWQTSLLTDGTTGATQITTVPSKDVSTQDINPEVGITSTPVIDPATNQLYVSAKTKQITTDPDFPHYVHTLFKVDLGSGAILGYTIIADTTLSMSDFTFAYRTNTDPTAAQEPFVFGSGDGAITVGGQSRVYFNGLREANRPGLLLLNGVIYIAYGSHGDSGPYHGWVLGFDATSLALTAALNLTPNGGLGGVWQGGGIPVVDANGYLYLATGNGTFDGNTDSSGATIGLDGNGNPVNNNYGDCFVKIGTDASSNQAAQNPNGWGLKVLDYFSPMNTQTLDDNDSDLGSGGVVVLPDAAGNVAHPHLLIGAGKEGKVYLVDRDNMGKFDPATDHVVQSNGNAIGGAFTSPAYFNGNIYYAGSFDVGKLFTIAGAALSEAPASQTGDAFQFPGATVSISANGQSNGIAWTIDLSTSQLRAYDATNLANELWTSAGAANNADQLGTPIKFTVPTVADGYVFVGTTAALSAYGAASTAQGPPQAPTNLVATAASGIQINLAWTDNSTNEDGFKIEQSSDGVTFQEIAAEGVNVQAASVTGLDVSTAYYFRVRAFNNYNTLSYSAYTNAASATTDAEPPRLDFTSGFNVQPPKLNYVESAALTANNTAGLTDSAPSEAGAVWSKQRQPISRYTSEFTFQIANPSANGFTFCIQNAGNKEHGAPGAALGYTGIKQSAAVAFIFSSGANLTGLYENGSAPIPNARAFDMSASGIDLHSGHIFDVTMQYESGVLTEKVTDTQTSAAFTQTYKANLPALAGSTSAFVGFTGATGAQTSTVTVLTWNYAVIPTHAPAPPSDLTAKPASGTQVNLKWKDNSSSQAGFIVERRIGTTGSFGKIGETGPTATTYVDTALVENTTYYYRVSATNAAGQSAESSAAKATPPSPPQTPTDAKATLVRPHRVTLAWKDNATNETGYRVLRKTSLQGNFTTIASLPVNSQSYSDATVAPDTTYDYHIQCLNVAGYSDFAGVTVATPSSP